MTIPTLGASRRRCSATPSSVSSPSRRCPRGERSARIAELAMRSYRTPDGRERRFSARTLWAWWSAYRQHGLEGFARLETGRRRPSLELLEKLAPALGCRVKDLLPEKKGGTMTTATEREPSMRGAPSYFRAGIREAARRRWGLDYSSPGYQPRETL
jgi:hypothetical protein